MGYCVGVHRVCRNRCGAAGTSLRWRLPRLGSGGGRRVSGCPDGLVVRQRHQAQDRRRADGVRILPRGAGLRAVAPGAATRHARRRALDTGSQADRRHDAPRRDVQHAPGALRLQRAPADRVARHRGRPECGDSHERRRREESARAERTHEEGAGPAVGNTTSRWSMGLARVRARAVGNHRGRVPWSHVCGVRRGHRAGPARRGRHSRHRASSSVSVHQLSGAAPLQPHLGAARLYPR